MKNLFRLGLVCLLAICLWSCSRDNQNAAQKSASASNASQAAGTTPAQLPTSDKYYVLDKSQKTMFEIDLNTNKISNRYLLGDNVVAIAYDMGRNWVYEAVGMPKPSLRVFDPRQGRTINTLEFAQPPTDLLYHPIKKLLFITSEDSTYFRVFSPDSMKFLYYFPLTITDNGKIGPRNMSPGPSGKIITANGARASVTQILTDNKYLCQTIIIKDAKFLDNAVFAFDGNSFFSCDTKQGKIYHVMFGEGEILGTKDGLDRPREIQFEVTNKTLVAVAGKTDVLMLNPDTFFQTGKVDLSQYGDDILTFSIPPKSNYAEVTMDFKGVIRWIRFDLKTWQPLRLVELI